MSDHIQQTITEIEARLRPIEEEARALKRSINELCKIAGIPLRFELTSNDTVGSITSDEFYGQPLSTAVRGVLEKRRASRRGAATVNEIYDALVAGGYKFESKNTDYAKRGLRQSLTKNTAVFHRLPNGQYGLLLWYPEAKEKPADQPRKRKKKRSASSAPRVKTKEGAS